MKRVTINVCGKRYETSRSVLEDKPDTMLAMLLRNQSTEEKEIFVQSDPRMFRWILYYYTSGILVEHDTVGVPKEVWDRELEYYSLFSAEEKKETTHKRLPPVDESHELASLAKKHLAVIHDRDDAMRAQRRSIYKLLLEHMMTHMHHTKNVRSGFSYIGKDSSQKAVDWPTSYPYELRNIDFMHINAHFDEFEEYGKQVGFMIEKISYHPCHMGKPKYPICEGHVKTQHQCMTFAISQLKE